MLEITIAVVPLLVATFIRDHPPNAAKIFATALTTNTFTLPSHQ